MLRCRFAAMNDANNRNASGEQEGDGAWFQGSRNRVGLSGTLERGACLFSRFLYVTLVRFMQSNFTFGTFHRLQPRNPLPLLKIKGSVL